jgi:hypothetical protein
MQASSAKARSRPVPGRPRPASIPPTGPGDIKLDNRRPRRAANRTRLGAGTSSAFPSSAPLRSSQSQGAPVSPSREHLPRTRARPARRGTQDSRWHGRHRPAERTRRRSIADQRDDSTVAIRFSGPRLASHSGRLSSLDLMWQAAPGVGLRTRLPGLVDDLELFSNVQLRRQVPDPRVSSGRCCLLRACLSPGPPGHALSARPRSRRDRADCHQPAVLAQSFNAKRGLMALNPAEMAANWREVKLSMCDRVLSHLQGISALPRLCSIASHARGRWFEPSRAHHERPPTCAAAMARRRLGSDVRFIRPAVRAARGRGTGGTV